MNELVPINALPALVTAAGERASMRFLEFFAANIRILHTRRAHGRAAEEFLAWCASAGVPSIAAVQPVHVATSGQTPVFDPAEARALLDSIDTGNHAGSRDRALIGLMVYSFARIGAALGMTVEDVFTQNRRLWDAAARKGRAARDAVSP